MIVVIPIVSAFVRLSLCACSSPSVVALPVTNVVLSNQQTMRGIPITVGTPPTNISILPDVFYNDTWIYNNTDTFCNWTTTNGCITARGGYYNTSSSTAKSAANVYAAGADAGDTARAIGPHIWYNAWVNDVLNVGNVTLSDYPIGMPGYDVFSPYITQGYLGLGANSTLLSALKSAGKIVSASFSWWVGWSGSIPSAQMDGQVVFGGYDAAKATGVNYTGTFTTPTPNCPSGMFADVTGIILNFPNGSEFPLMGSSSVNSEWGSIPSCLYPDYDGLIYTVDYDPIYMTFETFTGTSNIGHGGGNGVGFGGMIYPVDNVYQGAMTFTINGNVNVSIPNNLLVVPPGNISGENGAIQYNNSVREVLIGAATGVDASNSGIFGRGFFQMAYLSVDYDAATFTVWQANATTDTNLRAFGDVCAASATNLDNSTSTNPAQGAKGSSSGAHTVTSSVGQNDSHLSPGSVAGIVVGCVFGSLLVGLGSTLWCSRRRRLVHQRAGHIISLTEHEYQRKEMDVGIYNGRVFEPMSQDRHEMGATSDPSELPDDHRAAELQLWRTKTGTGNAPPAELGSP